MMGMMGEGKGACAVMVEKGFWGFYIRRLLCVWAIHDESPGARGRENVGWICFFG